jgi:hypothetical protein
VLIKEILMLKNIVSSFFIVLCIARGFAFSVMDNVGNGNKSALERAIISDHLNQISHEVLDYLILIGDGTSFDEDKAEIKAFMTQLEQRRPRFKTDAKFLEYVFYKVHQKYLKRYEKLTSFSDIVERGRYNCLTATAYYAIILDHFGYHYELIEMPHHIYLKLALDTHDLLIESTDPLNGFITDPNEIKLKLTSYLDHGLNADRAYSFADFQRIDLYQLIGLHYYNLAIKSYNLRDYKNAYMAVNKGLIFHKSDKMLELLNAVLQASSLPLSDQLIILQQIKIS